jgi:predicted alpha/beta superfamily hydrolase
MQHISAPAVFLRLGLWALLLGSLLCCSPKAQQLRLHLSQVPVTTPGSDTLYLAGSFNGWNPADPAYRLQQRPQGYLFSLPVDAGGAEFKITRGSWQTVETDAAGQDIPNRRLDLGKPGKLRLQVAGWKDQLAQPAAPLPSSAAANVQVLQDSFFMPQLNRHRRIWLYLPPGYDSSGKRYPVLYMHDGQNLFDAATAYAGEWGVDEILNRLIVEGQSEGVIVVGIDHGGEGRIPEYTPFVNSRYPSGEGAAYLQFIVETLKPHIDSTFRTLPEQRQTGLMGSSLGALISLYGAVEYPEVFGRIGLFSPAFWFNPQIFDWVEKGLDPAAGQRFLLLASEQESESMIPQMQQMHQLLQRKGVPGDRLFYNAHPDGAHSEWYWQREFAGAFLWLF